MDKKLNHTHLTTGAIIAIILLALLVIALDINKVIGVLSHARWQMLLIGFLFTVLSYGCFSYAFVL